MVKSSVKRDAWLLRRVSSSQMVAITFLGLILLGTLLLMLPIASNNGQGLGFVDALFTATSASCVTGLIVVDTGTYFTWFGKLVLIVLIQIGGLGIMTLTTLLTVIIGKKVSLQERLYLQESFNQPDVGGVVRLSLNIIKYALLIEFAIGTLLAFGFYDSLGLEGIAFGYWHAVSAFCNAGFDLLGDYNSLTNYTDNFIINFSIMLLIVVGGLGFFVLDDIKRSRSWRNFSLHTKIVLSTTFWLVVVGTVLLWLLEADNQATLAAMGLGEGVMAAAFQSITARTAGFNSLNLAAMHESSLFVLIILMFIGASPGSTGGGIKTTTFVILLLFTWGLLRGKHDVVIFGRRVEADTVNKAYIVVSLCIMWVLLAFLALLILDGGRHPFSFVLFEVVSAFATVGLGIGITHEWDALAKLILIFTMFIGRVGILTFVLSFLQRGNDKIKYPSEHINIG